MSVPSDYLCPSSIHLERSLSHFVGEKGIGSVGAWGRVSPDEWQGTVTTCLESSLQMMGSTAGMVLGMGTHLCLCLRSGAWATLHCPQPTGPWWVSRPSWRSPPTCQVPTAYKWLQSLGLGLGSPAALSASC